MATVTNRPRTFNLVESQRKVHHPLARLGSTIRRYVVLEVVATLCLYLALWFWIGLVLDYGLFKLFNWDWASRDMPRWPRAMVLGALLAGVIAFVEFRLHARFFTRLGESLSRTKSPIPFLLQIGASMTLLAWGLIVPDHIKYIQPIAVGLIVGAVVPVVAKEWYWGLAAGAAAALVALGAQLLGLHALTWIIGLAAVIAGVAAQRMQVLTAAMLCLYAVILPPPYGVAVILPIFGLILSYNVCRFMGLPWWQSLAVAPVVPAYLALWVYFSAWLDAGAFGAWEWLVVGLVGAALLCTMAAAMIARRMLYEFDAANLALLLERRFPEVLGDRLITAVELADVKKASRYGYSQEMIEHTIADAADRVDTVPVHEVFNWKRLTSLATVVGILSLGLYVAALAGTTAIESTAHGKFTSAGMTDFHDVAGTWFERNNLLQNRPWPRRALLEVIGFGDNGEIRIGQEAPAQGVRVRAYKWVVADESAPEGWRALRWSDLQKYIGEAPELPKGWVAKEGDWTVDQVEMRLNRTDVEKLLAVEKFVKAKDQLTKSTKVTMMEVNGHVQPSIEDKQAPGGRRVPMWKEVQSIAADIEGYPESVDLPADWGAKRGDKPFDEVEQEIEKTEPAKLLPLKEAVFDRLEALAESGNLRHELRKLVIPTTVYVTSWNRKSTNSITLIKQGDNEYAGSFGELKESIKFRAQGEDFYTRTYEVVVVPPPAIVALTREEYRPAYLYHRPVSPEITVPDGATVEDIKGKRQRARSVPMSLSGPESRIDVPVGTDVELLATTDKELEKVEIVPTPKAPVEIRTPVTMIDSRKFTVRFDNIRLLHDFTFSFVDTDGVAGKRHVVIKPIEDAFPEADLQVEIIRKTNQGYMITPVARIPFGGRLADDNGLAKAQFVYTLARLDNQVEAAGKSLAMLPSLFKLTGGIDQAMLTSAQVTELAKDDKNKPGKDEDKPKKADLKGFYNHLADRKWAEWPAKEKLADKLATPVGSRSKLEELTKEYKPDAKNPNDGFDLLNLPTSLKVSSESELQPRYKMQLWLEVTDNDIESGPHTSESKEKFAFVIVSENELLVEIAKEEENLYAKLDEMTGRLRESLLKLDQVKADLAAENLKAQDFGPMSIRAEEIYNLLDKSQTITQEVINDYQRIIEEEETNRVRKDMIEKLMTGIRNPLEAIRAQDFPDASKGMDEFRKVLDDKDLDPKMKTTQARVAGAEASKRVDTVIKKLQAILEQMEQIKGLNQLIKTIRDIEEENTKQHDLLAALRKQILDKLQVDLFGDDKKP